MKRKLAALLAALMLFSCAGGAVAAESSPGTPQQTQSAPYPGGINVSLNGKYLSFDGVAPISVDGRTLVPMRAFLEAFGAEVGYADGQMTAKLKNGTALELNTQSADMKITQDGKTQTVDLGAVPYAMSGRTYLPARPVGEALGLEVTWDSATKIVYLTDWAAVTAEIDTNFKNYNALIALSLNTAQNTSTGNKPMENKMNLTVSATLDDANAKGTATGTLGMTSLISADGMSMDVKADIDLGTLKDSLNAIMGQDAVNLLAALSGGSLQMITNSKTGDTYLKTDIAEKIGMAGVAKDAWYHTTSTADVLEPLGGADMTIGSLLVGYQQLFAQTLSATGAELGNPYEQAMLSSALMQVLFGDDVFTKKTSGETTTYSVDLGTTEIGQRLLKTGIVDATSIAALLGSGEIPTIRFTMTSLVKAEQVTDTKMSCAVKVAGKNPLDFNVDISGDGTRAAITITLKDAKDSVTVSMDSQMATTTQTVPVAPPQGAKILEAN